MKGMLIIFIPILQLEKQGKCHLPKVNRIINSKANSQFSAVSTLAPSCSHQQQHQFAECSRERVRWHVAERTSLQASLQSKGQKFPKCPTFISQVIYGLAQNAISHLTCLADCHSSRTTQRRYLLSSLNPCFYGRAPSSDTMIP